MSNSKRKYFLYTLISILVIFSKRNEWIFEIRMYSFVIY